MDQRGCVRGVHDGLPFWRQGEHTSLSADRTCIVQQPISCITLMRGGEGTFSPLYGFRPCPAFILTFSTVIRSSKTLRGSTLRTATRPSRRRLQTHETSLRMASCRTRTCRGSPSLSGTTMAKRSRPCRSATPYLEG